MLAKTKLTNVASIPVVMILIAINIIVMLIEFVLSKGFSLNINVLQKMGAINSNDYSIHLITYMFLHGGFIHIILNMLALLIIGFKLEKTIGSINFIIIYLLSGIIGGLFVSLFGSGLTVGASGAIMGIIGADIALHIKYKAYKTVKGKASLKSLLIDAITTLGLGIIPQISMAAHAGGLVGGIIIGYIVYSLVSQTKFIVWRHNLIFG